MIWSKYNNFRCERMTRFGASQALRTNSRNHQIRGEWLNKNLKRFFLSEKIMISYPENRKPLPRLSIKGILVLKKSSAMNLCTVCNVKRRNTKGSYLKHFTAFVVFTIVLRWKENLAGLLTIYLKKCYVELGPLIKACNSKQTQGLLN